MGVGDESDLMGEMSLREQGRFMASPSDRRQGRRVRGGNEREEEEEEIVLPRPRSKVKSSRISLFARPQDDDDEQGNNDDNDDDEEEGEEEADPNTRRLGTHERSDHQTRPQPDDSQDLTEDRSEDGDSPSTRQASDQKLKESLWELRKMVHVFEGFEESLRASKQGNEVGRPFSFTTGGNLGMTRVSFAGKKAYGSGSGGMTCRDWQRGLGIRIRCWIPTSSF